MTAAIFPAYFLARLVVSRPYAIFAAVGAVAAPALSYSPFLVDEPLAYPAATLAFLLIARAAVRPTRWSVGLALAACCLGVLVRTQLAVLFPVLALVLLAPALADRARSSAWRATWSAGDWVGVAVLVVGVAVVLSRCDRPPVVHLVRGDRVPEGAHARVRPLGARRAGDRARRRSRWSPALAALVRPRGEPRDERTTTFVALTVSALAVFGFYTAVKAAVPLDDLRDRRRRAEPDLPHAAALRRDRRSCSSGGGSRVPATVVATAFAVYSGRDDAVPARPRTRTTRRTGLAIARAREPDSALAGRRRSRRRWSSWRSASGLALVALRSRALTACRARSPPPRSPSSRSRGA